MTVQQILFWVYVLISMRITIKHFRAQPMTRPKDLLSKALQYEEIRHICSKDKHCL